MKDAASRHRRAAAVTLRLAVLGPIAPPAAQTAVVNSDARIYPREEVFLSAPECVPTKNIKVSKDKTCFLMYFFLYFFIFC